MSEMNYDWPIEVNEEISWLKSCKEHSDAFFERSPFLVFRSKEEKNRINDIKKLNGILSVIASFENDKMDIRDCLIEIGQLSSRISVTKDKEGIRLKYGSSESKSNKKGIYFDKLSLFELILKSEQILGVIDDMELVKLVDDLGRLKQGIIDILKMEKCKDVNSNTTDDFKCDDKNLSEINAFSDMYSETLTFVLIRRELDIWQQVEQWDKKTIDFGDRDDRYFIARLFSTIVGFLQQWKKDGDMKDNMEILSDAFKCLIKVRDRFIHHVEIISVGIPLQVGNINKTLKKIRTHLNEVFPEKLGDQNRSQINYKYEGARGLLNDLRALLQYMGKKTGDINLIIKDAVEIIKDIEDMQISGSDKLSIKRKQNKLKNVNGQYQKFLKENGDIDFKNYPAAVNIENKLILKQLYGNLSPLVTGKSIKKQDSNNIDKMKESAEAINNEVGLNLELVRKEIEYLFGMIDHTDQSRVVTSRAGSYDDSIHRGGMRRISKIMADVTDVSKFEILYQSLEGEVDSLFTRDPNNDPGMRKNQYIVHHIMLIISQILHGNKTTDSKLKFPERGYHYKYLTSTIIKSSEKLCRDTRSKGLAHNVNVLDNKLLHSRFIGCIKVLDHMESFHRLMKRSDESPSKIEDILKVCSDLYRINSHKEVVEHMEKILKSMESQPNEMITTDLDRDFTEIFGESYFMFKIREMIIICCLLSGDYENLGVLEKLKKIIGKINEEKLEKCENKEIREMSCFIYCLMGTYFQRFGDYNQALVFAEKADKLHESFSVKWLLTRNYLWTGKIQESIDLCFKILESDADCILKFLTLQTLIQCYMVMPDSPDTLSKIKYFEKQMNEIYETEKDHIKDLYGDKYLNLSLTLIGRKLHLLLDICGDQGFNKMHVRELEEIDWHFRDILVELTRDCDLDQKENIEWNEVLKKLEEHGNSLQHVARIFILLCMNYCYLYNAKNAFLDEGGKYLAVARQRFDDYCRIENNFNLHKNDKVLKCFQNSRQSTVEFLILAYNNYYKLSLDNSRFDRLLQVFDIVRHYDVKYVKNYNNQFAYQYFRVAFACYKLFEESLDKEYSVWSLKFYEETKRYLELELKDLEKSGNISIGTVTEYKFYLAHCNQDMALLKRDLSFLNISLIQSFDLLNASLPSAGRQCFQNRVDYIKGIHDNIVKVMSNIINSSSDIKEIDLYTKNYFKEKWSIEFSWRDERWNFSRDSSHDESINEMESLMTDIRAFKAQ